MSPFSFFSLFRKRNEVLLSKWVGEPHFGSWSRASSSSISSFKPSKNFSCSTNNIFTYIGSKYSH